MRGRKEDDMLFGIVRIVGMLLEQVEAHVDYLSKLCHTKSLLHHYLRCTCLCCKYDCRPCQLSGLR